MSPPSASWPRWVAWRYLATMRQDSLSRFLSLTAGLGIALGVAALILALAAMTGLQDAIRRLAVTGVDAARVVVEDENALLQVRNLVVDEFGAGKVATVIEGNGWVLGGSIAEPVRIVGYQGHLPRAEPSGAARIDSEPTPSTAPSSTPSSQGPPNRGWVRLTPGLLAGYRAGDVVELATSRPRVGPLGTEPTVVRARVESRSSGEATESTIYVDLDTGRRLLGGAFLPHLAITGDATQADEIVARLRLRLENQPITILGWESLQPGLWVALRMEKVLVFCAVFLIVVVAILALVAHLYMLMTDRRREVGILAALGAPATGIRQVFARVGLSIATLGSLAGVVLGVGAAWLLDRTGWIRLPGDGYLLEHVPFSVRPLDVLIIAGSAMALATLVCLVATREAARIQPVEALRQ